MLFLLYQLPEDVSSFGTAKDIDELRAESKDTESRPPDAMGEMKSSKAMAEIELNLVKDFEELKSKLHVMDSKLREVCFY